MSGKEQLFFDVNDILMQPNPQSHDKRSVMRMPIKQSEETAYGAKSKNQYSL
jgi:hypothetical protein